MSGREKGIKKLKKSKWLYSDYMYGDNSPVDESASMELFQDERFSTSNDYYMNEIMNTYNDYRDCCNY